MTKHLDPYRVSLKEDAGDKFTLIFDCMAEDADDAADQAGRAHPGCQVGQASRFEDSPLLHVVYSPNEAAINDGDGFWNNEHGWVNLEQADRFTIAEYRSLNLPMSTGQDARWMLSAMFDSVAHLEGLAPSKSAPVPRP